VSSKAYNDITLLSTVSDIIFKSLKLFEKISVSKAALEAVSPIVFIYVIKFSSPGTFKAANGSIRP
jgi:hypothetical protein